MNKMMSESERLRKSLSFMEKHMSALQEFQKNYPRWQDEYKHATDIQIAGEKLLAMQGINKNILGLQSTLEQSLFRTNSAIAESQKIRNQLLPASDAFKQTGIQALKNESASAIVERQRIPKDFLPASETLMQTGLQAFKNDTAAAIVEQHKVLRQNPLKDMVEKMGWSSSLGGMLDLIAEQSKFEKGSVFRSIVGDSDFLSQISKQSPFIGAVQSQMPKMEKIFSSTSVVMALASSESLISSILPVATSSLDFLSELDKLNFAEQKSIVDILEQINLDDEIDEELQEDLFAETRIDFSPYLESFQNFCKNHAFDIWALQMGYEKFTEDMTGTDFSNIIFDILFVVCFLVLISNLPSGEDDK